MKPLVCKGFVGFSVKNAAGEPARDPGKSIADNIHAL